MTTLDCSENKFVLETGENAWFSDTNTQDWDEFLRTWDEHIQRIGRLLTARCYYGPNPGEFADELTQFIRIKIYTGISGYRVNGNPMGWIYSIGLNHCIDIKRSEQRKKDILEPEQINHDLAGFMEIGQIDPEPNALQLMERAEVKQIINQAIARLNPKLKDPLLLRDMQEWEYLEIARHLEIPEGTVKSRINRGRSALAKIVSRRLRAVGYAPAFSEA